MAGPNAGSISVTVDLDGAAAVAHSKVLGKLIGKNISDGAKAEIDKNSKDWLKGSEGDRKKDGKRDGDAWSKSFRDALGRNDKKNRNRLKRVLIKWTAIVAAFGETIGVALMGAGSALTALVASLSFAASASLALIPIGAALGLGLGAIAIGAAGMGTAFGAVNAEMAEAVKEGRAFNAEAPAIQEALRGMSDNAIDVVTWFAGIREELGEIQKIVSDKLFEGIATALGDLTGGGFLQQASDGFGLIADEVNRFFLEIIKGFGEVDIAGLFTGLASILGNVLDGFADLVSMFWTFLEGALPAGERLSQMFADWASTFKEFIEQSSESGDLQAFLDEAIDSFQAWSDLIGATGGVLSTIFQAGKGTGDGFLVTLTGLLNTWDEWLKGDVGSASLQNFFATGERLIKALGPLVEGLAVAFSGIVNEKAIQNFENLSEQLGEIAPLLGELFNVIGAVAPLNLLAEAILAVGRALQPALPALEELGLALGGEISGIIANLTPTLEKMGAMFGRIATSLIPILAPLGQFITDIGELAGGAILALEPLINAVVDTLGDLFTELNDAGSLDVMTEALVPIGEALGVLAKVILPSLVPILVAAGEALAFVALLFAGLAKVILLAEGPLIAFGEFLGTFFDRLLFGLQAVGENLLTAFDWLGNLSLEDVFNNLYAWWTGFFDAVNQRLIAFVDGVVSVFTSLRDGILGVLNSFLEEVNTFFTETLGRVWAELVSWKDDMVATFFDFIAAVTDIISPFVEFFVEIWDGLFESARTLYQTFLGQFVDDMKRYFNNVVEFIGGFVDFFRNIWNGLFESARQLYQVFLGQFVTDIKRYFNNVVNFVRDFVARIKNYFDNWNRNMENLKNNIQGKLNAIRGFFVDSYNGVKNWVLDIISEITSLPGMITSAMSGVADAISAPFKAAVAPVQAAVNSIKRITDGIGGVISSLNPFAKGGIVTGPTPALIGEAGAEAVIPLTRPLAQVDPAVRGMAAMIRGENQGGYAASAKQSSTTTNSTTNNWTINDTSGNAQATATRVMNRMAVGMK